MNRTTEQIGADLSGLVKGDVRVDIFSRIAFSTDASIYQIMPQCVVSPVNTADVAAVVRYAADHGIAVVGRGAGSGLAGEALCDGIVLDMMRHMNRVLSIEEDGSRVTVEPGVVLDDLNNMLAKYGKKIGPDPSSGNRAVIGGIVGNNSTGAHSLEYGFIADFVEAVEVVLADGSVVELTNDVDPQELDDPCYRQLAQACVDVLAGKEQIIAAAQPKTKRNRCGYNIVGACHDGRIDLARLVAGSEGTLAVYTRLTLRTVDVPACKALMQIEFESIDKMAQAVPLIVDSGASTCELMDRAVLKMAAESLPAYRDIFPVHCAAAMLVEHCGASEAEVLAKIERTEQAIAGLAEACKRVLDPNQQKRLWKSRKDAVPLLHREKGPRQPIPFMEDVSVDNRRLAEYLRGLEAIGKRHGVSLVYYGHAGDGELHVRPYLDLTSAQDVAKMQSLAAEVFELAWSLGGTISGEHADGLLRTAFIRRQYGDAYYELLRGIKHAFDPHEIMNPGKLISDDPDVMIRNLRASNPVLTERLKTNLLFDDGEFRYEIEQCNGCGVCLSTQAGSRLCPVHRALKEELACSRAKANLLRAWITGKLDHAAFASDEFKRILSLCVNCKMCSVQCPSGVDVSKLIMEARSQLIKCRGMTLTEKALVHNRYLSAIGSMFAPVSGFVMDLAPFRWVMEKAVGIDRRRRMPRFQHGTFVKKGRRYLAAQPSLPQPVDKVAYFADSFANYNDHALGMAAIRTLRHNGVDVVLPEQLPAPITAAAYGAIDTARYDFEYVPQRLAGLVRSGYKIVCSEPSAALCLRDELKRFIDSEDARLVSAATFELMDYLNRLRKAGKLKTEVADPLEGERYVYHSPCHLCALGVSGASVELLSALTRAEITDVEAGCCGIAGTYGMQKKNYETSMQIGAPMAEALNAIEIRDALTECGACGMQIEHMTDKRVTHPIKVLARAYGVL